MPILLLLLLELSLLGSVLLVPVVAAVVVWLELEPRGSRAAAWFGLSIGMGMAVPLPLYTLLVLLTGQAWGYRFAPIFGLGALLLGVRLVDIHLRRLRGAEVAVRGAAYACIAFAALVALALVPLLTGAVAPVGCGEFAAEPCGPSGGREYASIVVPLVAGMGLEAWTLLRLDPSRPA